ncbi:MAG: cysteine hydrolase [Lachnospiraceae bacterium]|nr:cysteine hydrolase [Lachnospiraceae bacterium]
MDKRFEKPLALVIDMQNVYSKGQQWECENFDCALFNINKLLECMPKEDVIFTRYIASESPTGVWKDYNRENESVNNNEWLNEIADALKENSKKYACYDKSVYSSLSIDEIKTKMQEKTCVVVTGVVAECCVLSTVMDLIDEGVYVVYLKDAIAGINEETEKATLKILEGLAPLHLKIMGIEDYLERRNNC